MSDKWKLRGRLFIEGSIQVRTDIRVGGDELSSPSRLYFASPDNPVVRNAAGVPFIPGSTLKGNLRASLDEEGHGEMDRLWEKASALYNSNDYDAKNINKKDYGPPVCHVSDCWICRVFGRNANEQYREPTRLRVEDCILDKERLEKDFPLLCGELTVVRTENAIHRLLGLANPRRSEYVPAGAVFNMRLMYNVYSEEDLEKGVPLVLKALHKVQDAGIGGSRTRGCGSVSFINLKIRCKTWQDYENGDEGKVVISGIDSAGELQKKYKEKLEELKNSFKK